MVLYVDRHANNLHLDATPKTTQDNSTQLNSTQLNATQLTTQHNSTQLNRRDSRYDEAKPSPF